VFNEFIAYGLILFLFLSLVFRSRYSKIPIWALMAFATFITIVTGLVNVEELSTVIDFEVIFFLIGMFSIVALADTSGLLDALAVWFISKFKTRYSAIIGSAFLFGILAAFTVNDTVALMGPPIAYSIAKILRVDPRMMFLLLAFSLTIGSVMTPIGNPQNVLIAIESGIKAPFIEFIKWLAIPTMLNIYVTSLYLIKAFKISNGDISIQLIPWEKITCKRDAILGAIGLIIVPAILIINDILFILNLPHIEHIGFIPFIVAAALYIASSEPRKILGRVDWGTIVFFISMFIVVDGIWRTGVIQGLLKPLSISPVQSIIQNTTYITIASIIFSQVISNVPFTKFYISYMKLQGFSPVDTIEWIVLAMSTTIAGNLTLLGAASNIIVVETLESRYNYTISFIEFSKHGVIVTAINLLIYLADILFFNIFT